MAPPSAIPPDTLLAGKIRLLQRIGSGGMGDVWIARNEATHAEVAVKTLQRSERTKVHDERFRREARLAATVSHRNVVRIFDLVDEADGTLGLVMELLRGGTLEACMRERGPMSTLHAIAVAAPILSALDHVHEKGIVHRDVKPANIFFAVEPDGHVIPKILDFGIAKLPAAGSALTMEGSVLGTPHYMSPEQIRGVSDLDGRSDMFSMAVLLFEMLTGERPFQRDTASASLAAVLEYEVDPDPRIEPRVWVAISRALAKRPYERFAGCAEFAEALRSAVSGTEEDFANALQELRPATDSLPPSETSRTFGLASSVPRPMPTLASVPPGRRRSILWAVSAAGVAAALAVTATLALTRASVEPAPPVDPRAAAGTASAVVLSAAQADPSAAAPPVTAPTATSPPNAPPVLVRPPTVTPVVKPARPNGARPTTTTKPPPGAKPIATSPGF